MKSTIFLNTIFSGYNAGPGLLLEKDNDLRSGNGIADRTVGGVCQIEPELEGVVIRATCVQVTLPGKGKVDFSGVAGKGGQLIASCVKAGGIGCGQGVKPGTDPPQIIVAHRSAVGEFKCNPHRVVGLNSGIDGYKGKCRLTGITFVAADHYEGCYDQCYQYSGYQKRTGFRFHET
jgi:hypothetical protein